MKTLILISLVFTGIVLVGCLDFQKTLLPQDLVNMSCKQLIDNQYAQCDINNDSYPNIQPDINEQCIAEFAPFIAKKC